MPSNGPDMVANRPKKLVSYWVPYCTHTAARNKTTDIRIIAKLSTKVHDPMFDIHISERWTIYIYTHTHTQIYFVAKQTSRSFLQITSAGQNVRDDIQWPISSSLLTSLVYKFYSWADETMAHGKILARGIHYPNSFGLPASPCS
jgi:hypothetical protein